MAGKWGMVDGAIYRWTDVDTIAIDESKVPYSRHFAVDDRGGKASDGLMFFPATVVPWSIQRLQGVDSRSII